MMKEKKIREKGLIIVHTGNGKGKSSSAFGMIMRCIAHGMPCGVVQFIKGNWITGEKRFLRERFAQGIAGSSSPARASPGDTQDREADIAAARHGWEEGEGDDPRTGHEDGGAGRDQHRAALRLSAGDRGRGVPDHAEARE